MEEVVPLNTPMHQPQEALLILLALVVLAAIGFGLDRSRRMPLIYVIPES